MEQENRFKVVGKGGKMLFAGNIKECRAYIQAYHQALATHTKMQTEITLMGDDYVHEIIDGNQYAICEIKPFEPMCYKYMDEKHQMLQLQMGSSCVIVITEDQSDFLKVLLPLEQVVKLRIKLTEFEQHLKDMGK